MGMLNDFNVPIGVAVVANEAAARTYTPAEIFGGLILRDPNGGARTDVLPTAALLKAFLDPGRQGASPLGRYFDFHIRNTADASEVITVAAGTGGSTSGTMTIAQNASKNFRIVITNAPGGSDPTYTCYSLGSVAV